MFKTNHVRFFQPYLPLRFTSTKGHRLSSEDIQKFVKTSRLFSYTPNKQAVGEKLLDVFHLDTTPSNIQELSRFLKKGPFTTQNWLFLHKKFDELVVLAHIAGMITMTQLATAFYMKSALTYRVSEVTEVPLFLPNGSINPIAKAYVHHGVMPVQGSMPFKAPAFPNILTHAQIDLWFKEMSYAPESEKLFLQKPISSKRFEICQNFLTPHNPLEEAEALLTLVSEYTNPRSTPTILDLTHQSSHLNLFNRIEVNGEMHRIVPSITMVQTLCRLIRRDGVNLIPRFGCSETQLDTDFLREKDISLVSSFTRLPKRADGYWAPFEEFTSHDLVYHAPLLSFIPIKNRRLYLKLAEHLQAEGCLNLANRCRDMEFSIHRHRKVDSRALFMASLQLLPHLVRTQKLIDDCRPIANDNQLSREEKTKAIEGLITRREKPINKKTEIHQTTYSLFSAAIKVVPNLYSYPDPNLLFKKGN